MTRRLWTAKELAEAEQSVGLSPDAASAEWRREHVFPVRFDDEPPLSEVVPVGRLLGVGISMVLALIIAVGVFTANAANHARSRIRAEQVQAFQRANDFRRQQLEMEHAIVQADRAMLERERKKKR